VVALALSLMVGAASTSVAQASPALPDLAARLSGMTAVTGYEQPMIDSLLGLLPGAARDRAGNAVLVLGSGSRRRLVACPVSEQGFVVGGVRDDGWLTLRRSAGKAAPMLEAQLEGQRVTVFGRQGPRPGVVAVRSIHLTRGRSGAGEGAFTVDSAYVDIGATSSADVAAAGIGVLSPVALTKRPQRYGSDRIAAPVAGRRTACAALVLAARDAAAGQGMVPREESVIVAFIVEQDLSARGLATLAAQRGPFTETVLLDAGDGALGSLRQSENSEVVSQRPGLGVFQPWTIGVRYVGSAVETASLGGADSLRAALRRWIGRTK
jgi:putative aminopeptidase FrvX